MKVFAGCLLLAILLVTRPSAHATDSTSPDSTSPGSTNTDSMEPIHVIATDWGLTLRSDGTGFYNDLAAFVLPPSLAPVNYEILPYKRAKRQFFDEKKACLYPTNLDYQVAAGFVDDPAHYVSSAPLVAIQTRVFTRAGTPPPARLADLDRHRVTYALGSNILSFLRGSKAIFIAVADEVNKAKMLLEGRADMLIADLPDAKFVFDHLEAPMQQYHQPFALNRTTTGLVCHRTAANTAFIEAFNAHLNRMIETGAYEQFFRDNGLDPAAHLPTHSGASSSAD